MDNPVRQLKESPSQTAGPYVHIGCVPGFTGINIFGADLGSEMKKGPVKGQDIKIVGKIIDADNEPVLDAVVEIWQADANGLFNSTNEVRGEADPNFTGWGRSAINPQTGEYSFDTLKPGCVPWHDGRLQAPHVSFWIVARGINIGLQTRLYFADEEEANSKDPRLSSIKDPSRASTFIAKDEGSGIHRFNICLQGDGETVFLDI